MNFFFLPKSTTHFEQFKVDEVLQQVGQSQLDDFNVETAGKVGERPGSIIETMNSVGGGPSSSMVVIYLVGYNMYLQFLGKHNMFYKFAVEQVHCHTYFFVTFR